MGKKRFVFGLFILGFWPLIGVAVTLVEGLAKWMRIFSVRSGWTSKDTCVEE